MNVIERMKNKDRRSVLIDVQFPTKEPILKLTFKRLANEEIRNAGVESIASGSYNAFRFAQEVCKRLQFQLDAWEGIGVDAPKLSKETAKDFFSELTIAEQVELSNAYMDAATQDEEKAADAKKAIAEGDSAKA